MCAYAVLQRINRACVLTRFRAITRFRTCSSDANSLTINNNVNNEKIEDSAGTASKEEGLCDKMKTETIQSDLQCNTVIDKVEDVDKCTKVIPLQPVSQVNDENLKTMLYVKNEETAANIVSMIINDLSKHMSYVVEINSGFGFLTEKLLQAGVPKVHAFEKNSMFDETLSALQNKYPGRLNVQQYNLLDLPRLLFLDQKIGEDNIGKIFKSLKLLKLKEECNIQIIGIIPHIQFMRHIILSTIFREGIMARGCPCFYFLVPAFMLQQLGCLHNYSRKGATRILFQVLFDYKILGRFNRKLFIPEPKPVSRLKNRSNTFIHNQKFMYCLKIEPKPEIYQGYIKNNNLIGFWYFVRHFMNKKRGRVIPELEKIAPGYGVELIMKDYNIFTEFSDLKPMDVLDIFNGFQSWPGYEESIFMPAVDMMCMQLQKSIYTYHDGDNEQFEF